MISCAIRSITWYITEVPSLNTMERTCHKKDTNDLHLVLFLQNMWSLEPQTNQNNDMSTIEESVTLRANLFIRRT